MLYDMCCVCTCICLPQLKNKYGDAFIRGNNGETAFLLNLLVCLMLNFASLFASALHQHHKKKMNAAMSCTVVYTQDSAVKPSLFSDVKSFFV